MGYNWERIKMTVQHIKNGFDIETDNTLTTRQHIQRAIADLTLQITTRLTQGIALIGLAELLYHTILANQWGIIGTLINIIVALLYVTIAKNILAFKTEIDWDKWGRATGQKKGETTWDSTK